jgi:uncharacterized membrane protein YidH (DUF202 family)
MAKKSEKKFLAEEQTSLSEERTILSYVRTVLAIVGAILVIITVYFKDTNIIFVLTTLTVLCVVVITEEVLRFRKLRHAREKIQNA